MILLYKLWIASCLLLLIVPTCLFPQTQKYWRMLIERLEYYIFYPMRGDVASNSGQTEQYLYELSSEQEEEIRESFLIDKLKEFSMTIQEGDIKGLEESSLKEDEDDTTPADVEAGGNDKVTSSEEQEDRNDSIDSCCEEDERGAEAGYLLIPVPCATSTDGTEADATTFRKTPNGCAVCLSHFEVDEKITWSSNAECKHIFHQECILDWFKASGSRYCRRRWRQEQREGGTIHYTSDPRTQITSFPMNCPCCRQCFIANGEMTEKKSNLSDLSAMASTVASSISNSSSAEDAEQTLEGFVAAEAAVSSAEVPQGTEDSVVVATAAGNTTITATTPMSTVVGSEDSV